MPGLICLTSSACLVCVENVSDVGNALAIVNASEAIVVERSDELDAC